MPKLKTHSKYIEDVLKVHGDKYLYDKVEYVGNKKRVIIECKLHGEFQQIAADHLKGCGCPKCGLEGNFNYNMKDSLKEENKDKPLDFYIVKLSRGEECFLKVGISKEVKKRHINIKTKSSYNVENMFTFSCTVKEGTIIESKVLKHFRYSHRYNPHITFPGYKECLLLGCQDDIVKEVGKILEEDFNRSSLVGKIIYHEYSTRK